LGLNTANDTYNVFTVIGDEDNTAENTPVLKVSGEIYGAVTSKESYRN
jgi:hypothetical protein